MRKIIPLHHFKPKPVPCSIKKRKGGGVIYIFYIRFNNIIISAIHSSSTVLGLNGVSGGAGAYHSCLQARGSGVSPWTSRRLIQGLTYRKRRAYTLIYNAEGDSTNPCSTSPLFPIDLQYLDRYSSFKSEM